MGWIWSESARTYSDSSTGDVISKDDLASLQTDFVGKMGDQFRETATSLHGRGASPDEWETALRPIVDRTQAISYQLARGGSNAMTSDDWSTVSEQVKAQYDYLNAFAADAGTGQLTEEQAADRAGMYADGARGGYAQGLGSAWDISFPVDLPVHPNCNCSWQIENEDDGVKAYYIVEDPCPICAGYADQYNPYDPSQGD
jgi:hypothetical protein